MSAIFGIIYKNGKPAGREGIMAMQEGLLHRAADSKGTWFAGNIGLGHHKLIVAARQQYEAMPFEDGDLVITADASIFNREDLFARLGIDKQRLANYPDERLILTAYRKWGGNCLEHLEGEFAIAIWNKVTSALFIAVDHIGFRPLYYFDTPELFVFSSEMKGILRVKTTLNIFNEAVLIDYFFRNGDQAKTYNAEIFFLPGGNKLTLNGNRVTVEKYWTPVKAGQYNFKKDSEWAECLRDLLVKAVEHRMDTDRPIGITLSGGLDSSSIACIAGRVLEKRNKPLYAFSSVLPVGHKGVEADERSHIAIVGKHLKNLVQTFVEVPEVGPFTNLEQAFEIEESIPNAFFYMDQAINSAAAANDIRVLLTGFGGDFFVSWHGNSVIYQLIRQFRLADAARIFSQTRRYERKGTLQLVKTDIIAFTGIYKILAPMLHRNKRNWQYYTMLRDEFASKYSSKHVSGSETDQSAIMIDQIANGYTSRLIGMYANRDAAYGMSTAMPMFDKKIMEFMLDVPILQFRDSGTRRSLIRRAMAGILPPEIQWRSDKQPYSPDYVRRIIKDKQFINAVIQSDEFNFVWKFIDRERIIANIDQLKPASGMTRSSEVSGIRMSQAIISSVFLYWLKLNNYEF